MAMSYKLLKKEDIMGKVFLSLSTFIILFITGCITPAYIPPDDLNRDMKSFSVKDLCFIRNTHDYNMGVANRTTATKKQKQDLMTRLANANAELKRRNPFTKQEWQLIKERKVKVGMSKKALICSWGRPERVHSSSYGSDQYVYENYQYVYFKNNRVSAWSN